MGLAVAFDGKIHTYDERDERNPGEGADAVDVKEEGEDSHEPQREADADDHLEVVLHRPLDVLVEVELAVLRQMRIDEACPQGEVVHLGDRPEELPEEGHHPSDARGAGEAQVPLHERRLVREAEPCRI